MGSRPIAAVLTLGCKLNLADSEELGRGLHAAGYHVVDRLCDADAYVINTCSVTHVADQKSRRLIRAARRMSPVARVVVAGCYPRTAEPGFIEDLGADLVTGTRPEDREAILAFLGGSAVAHVPARADLPAGALHTRRFIRAQAGCNDVCAFCIVPRTRGPEASRPVDDVVEAVNAASAARAREVIITGTQLGAWGRDLDGSHHPHHLIAALLERTEVQRIRFSSLQPQDITPELLALWRDPRLMPHFHLALQSGSDAVLARMRRRYTRAAYLDAAARIRAAVPDVAITTDVIAGFPGESADDFEETLLLCREVAFARIHAFPYSPRRRTAAAAMDAQVPPDERKERMSRLLALAADLEQAYRRQFVGTVRPVLWEERRTTASGPRWHGHTDNYIAASLPAREGEDLRNRITPVELTGVYDDGVEARVLVTAT